MPSTPPGTSRPAAWRSGWWRERLAVDHLVLQRSHPHAADGAAARLAALLPQLSLDALTDPRLREQHFGVVDGMRGRHQGPARASMGAVAAL